MVSEDFVTAAIPLVINEADQLEWPRENGMGRSGCCAVITYVFL